MKRGDLCRSLSDISEKTETSSPVVLEGCNVGASTSAVADEIPPVPKCRDVAAEIEPAEMEPAEIEPAEMEPAEIEPAEIEPAEIEPAETESEATESGFMAKVAKCWKCCRPSKFCKCLKPADILNVRAVSIDSEQASENALEPPPEEIRKTHYLSNLIPRVQCFFIPTNVSVENRVRCSHKLKAMKQILGVYVKFKKVECNASMCVKCPYCGVCPHLYNCSCPNKYKYQGSQWCAHLHTMHIITKDKYKGGMSLYIHTDIRYMLVRHLRANVLGYEIMNPIPGKSDDFEELYINADILTKYKAMRKRGRFDPCKCRQMDWCNICSTCRCKFSCDCPDYCIDKMACMHIHCLGVRFNRKGLDKLNESHLAVKHKLTEQEDKNLKYIVALEHEMSFYIKPKKIKKQEGPLPDDLLGESCIRSVVERPVRQANDPDTPPEESLDSKKTVQPKHTESWWKIYKKSRGKRVEDCRVWTLADGTGTCVCDNKSYQYCVCERCEICPDDYRCSCPLDDVIICRHIHAVHRLRTELHETEEEAENFVRSHLNLPAILQDIP